MSLRQDGDYWYGDGPDDVWEYFVSSSRDSAEPVGHFNLESEVHSLTATRGKDSVRISFDSLQRIVNVEGTLKPSLTR